MILRLQIRYDEDLFARVNTALSFSGRQSGLLLFFVSFLLVMLTGCRQERVEERAYRLLAATLEEGGTGLRQSNRVDAMRITYAVNAQGRRAEDVAYAHKVEALQQSTDSLLGFLGELQSTLLSLSELKPGSKRAVQAYLSGNGLTQSRGALYRLYGLLMDHRKPLADVLGQAVPPGTVFPSIGRTTNHPTDSLRTFLHPFREGTATAALALLAAYKTHVLLLQARVHEHAEGRLGYVIRDNRISLVANPERDRVKIGSLYRADLYLTVGLENWFLYEAVIDGKPVYTFPPRATLTVARRQNGKPPGWEARLYLFNQFGQDTVLTIRRPFPLPESTSLVFPRKP